MMKKNQRFQTEEVVAKQAKGPNGGQNFYYGRKSKIAQMTHEREMVHVTQI